MTPLLYACFAGKREIAAVLLELGADPNIASITGLTPMECVIGDLQSGADERECIALIETMIAKGADVEPLRKSRRMHRINQALSALIEKHCPPGDR